MIRKVQKYRENIVSLHSLPLRVIITIIIIFILTPLFSLLIVFFLFRIDNFIYWSILLNWTLFKLSLNLLNWLIHFRSTIKWFNYKLKLDIELKGVNFVSIDASFFRLMLRFGFVAFRHGVSGLYCSCIYIIKYIN